MVQAYCAFGELDSSGWWHFLPSADFSRFIYESVSVLDVIVFFRE